MTSHRNLGESGKVVQTLLYGLRKSRKNVIPVATIPKSQCHMCLIHVLHCNTTR